MNNHRQGNAPSQNQKRSHNNNRSQAPSTGGQSLRPSKNRHHPNRGGNQRFLNNRARNPQAPQQNASQPQGQSNRPGSFDKVFRRYEYLQEQHCIARRKYFENYYKTEGTQRERTEKNFYSTLEQLRDYVSTLSFEQKEAFEKKYNGNPVDTTYSETHGLPAQAERVRFADKFEDPHVLKTQLESNYSSDTEESVGTLDDYKLFKGIA